MENKPFVAKRIIRSYRQTIHGAPGRVFELLCPVREAEWLHGWDYRIVYSQSGFAEEGCVFASRADGGEETLWLITLRDESNRKIEFTRFTPGSRVARLNIRVKEDAAHESLVDISYTFTALTEQGNDFIDGFTREKFESAMKFWEDSMNYYLRTGEKLLPERDF